LNINCIKTAAIFLQKSAFLNSSMIEEARFLSTSQDNINDCIHRKGLARLAGEK